MARYVIWEGHVRQQSEVYGPIYFRVRVRLWRRRRIICMVFKFKEVPKAISKPYKPLHQHRGEEAMGTSYRDKLTRDAHVEPANFSQRRQRRHSLTHSLTHNNNSQSPNPKKPQILKRGERLELISSTVLASTSVRKRKLSCVLSVLCCVV